MRQRGFNFATIPLQFSFQNPTIEPRFLPRSATIAPRSGHDRASIVAWMLRRRPSEHVGNSPLRFHAEGGTIAARSHRDRGVLPRVLSAVRLESRELSDVDQVSRPIFIAFDQLAAAV